MRINSPSDSAMFSFWSWFRQAQISLAVSSVVDSGKTIHLCPWLAAVARDSCLTFAAARSPADETRHSSTRRKATL